MSADPSFMHEQLGGCEVTHCSGPAGTAFVMDSRLLHFGGSNLEGKGERRVLFYLSFRKATTQEGEEEMGCQGENLEAGEDLEAKLVAPPWWVANGGERLVDRETMMQLQLYESSLGATMSLFQEYEGKFTTRTLLENVE